jgi:Protein of unknown function (DUF2934)
MRTHEDHLKPTSEEIACLAYEIWEYEGCPHGHDVQHWLEAETLLIKLHQCMATAPDSPDDSVPDAPAIDFMASSLIIAQQQSGFQADRPSVR